MMLYNRELLRRYLFTSKKKTDFRKKGIHKKLKNLHFRLPLDFYKKKCEKDLKKNKY